jgi:hypothetical protein
MSDHSDIPDPVTPDRPDHNDPSYVPGSEHASVAQTTPSQRLLRDGRNMYEAVKRRVDKVFAEEGLPKRCLIENTDECNIVHYAHCLPRATDASVVSSCQTIPSNLTYDL